MEERGNPSNEGKGKELKEVTPPGFDLLTVDTDDVDIEALKGVDTTHISAFSLSHGISTI